MIIDKLSLNEKELVNTIKAKKDNIIFYENDPCNGVFIVKKGEIHIASITFEGNEIVYNALKEGDMFGNNLLFSKDNRYRGNVIAKTDSELIKINKDNLIYILQHNEQFLTEYLVINSEFTKSLNSKIKILSFTSAKERMLYYLFINNGQIEFKSVSSLSNSLFLSREATSRLISQMVANKEIKRVGNKIIKEG